MKCPRCNLVNFRDARSCKRCGSQLSLAAPSADPVAGLAAADKCLVVRSPYSFPDRCLKCNQPVNSDRQSTELKYYPKYNAVLLLLGFLFYKKIPLKLPLCRKHIGTRTNISGILSVLLVTGVIAFVIGLFTLNFILILFGALMIAGSVLVDFKHRPLTVAKMSDDQIWIKGAGQKFLSTLPVFTE